ncbi:MAG: chemotaxis response regulator protein-glutamate methylesterase [Planctomycetota bacterium]|nr:MAG: chemotaxis response regulator protein-glutamate methylesterase [Planctomycetota bacterium]
MRDDHSPQEHGGGIRSRSEAAVVKILVVDDSAFMRRSLTKLIESDPDLRVVDTARDGEDAVEKAKRLRPDLITLDVEMPKMNGLDALRKIMVDCPTTVLMVSSLTTKGSREALKALRLGAADFIAKDASFVSLNLDSIRDELIAKIKALGPLGPGVKKHEAAAPRPAASGSPPEFEPDRFDLLVIGSSTGGPPVVETIAGSLAPDLACPVVLAQHMPAVFTKSLAERLNAKCAVSVYEAEDGMPLYPGTMYIAPGGQQTRVRASIAGGMSLRVNDTPADALYKPSVNVLFESAAATTGGKTLGVVLTGMGDDGAAGSAQIVEKGGVVLTQSADTCVVYGMPKAVDDAGCSQARLSPQQLCRAIGALRATDSGTPAANRKAG